MASARYFTHAQADPHGAQILDHTELSLKGSLIVRQQTLIHQRIIRQIQMKNLASVSIDVDTLSSIYKGLGLNRPGGYTFIELRSGLETIQRFFEAYHIKTTLFMVGNDFHLQSNHAAIQSIIQDGHEPANHSMTHPQGFRWLSPEQKNEELRSMGDICESVTGIRPIGFRSPGWNIDDSTTSPIERIGITDMILRSFQLL